MFLSVTALNVLVALAWLLRPAGWMPSLAVGIPVGLMLIWLVRRRVGRDPRAGNRAYYVLSGIVLVLSWLPVAALTALVISVEEPWPISLRHGPDTGYAAEVFETTFGRPADQAVTELYGRTEWAGFGEHITSVKFRYTDEAVLTEIVESLSLERVPPGQPDVDAWPGPPWWPPQQVLAHAHVVYRSSFPETSQVFRRLWIDEARRLAYFQDVDVG